MKFQFRLYSFELIFKLEMCVHVFINKKLDNILALFYTIFVNLYGQLFAKWQRRNSVCLYLGLMNIHEDAN